MITVVNNYSPKRISSHFGMRIHPITKQKKMHNGIDLAYSRGEKVYSLYSGKVIISKMQAGNKGYGNYIVIYNDNKTYSLYAHLDTRAVSSGAYIKQGQYIGKIGSTGDSTGPHLHFGMATKLNTNYIDNSSWIDPEPVLNKELEERTEMVETGEIIFNGKKIKVKRILKEGENYIRLRDLEDALCLCHVDYDKKEKLPIIKK